MTPRWFSEASHKKHHVCTSLSPSVPPPTADDFGCAISIRGAMAMQNCRFDSFQVPTKDINHEVPPYPISIIWNFLYFCFIYRCHKLLSLLRILDYYCRIAVGKWLFYHDFYGLVGSWLSGLASSKCFGSSRNAQAFGTTFVPRKPIAFQLQVPSMFFCLLPFRCCTSAPIFRFQPQRSFPYSVPGSSCLWWQRFQNLYECLA